MNGRAGREREAVLFVIAARHVQQRVAGKGIRLDELRGVRRVPRAAEVLPLAVDAGHRLEVPRHVLGQRHLDRAVLERAPRVVLLLEDDAARRIDRAEAAERLVRPARVDAVDVDARPHVLVTAVNAGDIQAHQAGELLAEAEDHLVDEGLMQAVGEFVIGNRCAAGRRNHRGLEPPVAVDVVLVTLPRRLVGAEQGDRVPPHHLLVHARIAAAQHVARILGEQVREAEPRTNRAAVLPHDVEDLVVALDEIGADAEVHRQPVVGVPRVLHIERKVAVARRPRGQRHRRVVAAVERHGAAGDVAGGQEPVFLEHEPAVDVLGRLVVGVARGRKEPGLKLVAARQSVPVVRQVAAQHDLRCRLVSV